MNEIFLAGSRGAGRTIEERLYRVTSLISNPPPVGPYFSPMSGDLWWSWGCGCFS